MFFYSFREAMHNKRKQGTRVHFQISFWRIRIIIMAGRDGGAYRLCWLCYAYMRALLTHIHSYSLTVFSPSGKLVQIEHALAAVSQGTTSLGIKGTLS
jgi:hypothetical protein